MKHTLKGVVLLKKKKREKMGQISVLKDKIFKVEEVELDGESWDEMQFCKKKHGSREELISNSVFPGRELHG